MKKFELVSNSRIGILAFLSLFIAFISIAFLLPNPVLADVPSVLNVDPWTNGTETILNITVRHSAPSSFHYIDTIQIDVDGTIENVNLDPQSTNPFVTKYNLGEVSGEPSARVRAHCTLHGWGSWSEPQVIPEFSAYLTVIFFMVATLIGIFLGRKIRG